MKAADRMKKIEIIERICNIFPFFYLLRNNQNIRNFSQIVSDYQKLKKDSSFLKDSVGVSSKKNILIVSLSHFIYQVKLEAMLAKAFQMAGCQVRVLTWSHFFWPRKYFRLFGIKDFIYFDHYLKKVNNLNLDDDKQKLIQQGLDFKKIKGWRFKNCRVGQQILSKMARRMHGTPKIEQGPVYDLFIYYLKKQIKTIYAADKLLDTLTPDILIFNEANESVYGAFFDLGFAKKLDIIQFVQPLRDDSLIFKRFNDESKGLHPNSLSKSTFETIKTMLWSDKHEKILREEFLNRYGEKWFLSKRNHIGTVKKEKYHILEQLGINNNKKIAVVFSHVLWDANLFYGDDLFEDYEDWFIQTVKAACKNSNVNWLIKMHPANIWKRKRDRLTGEFRENILVEKYIGDLPENVYLLRPDTDINTLSLFEIADYGITVRGTTGMEFPCYGKPFFTAGTGRYSGFGFTIDSDSQQDYLNKLENIHNYGPLTTEQTLLAKKHAYAVFILRHWEMKSFKSDFNYQEKGCHPLDHNLFPIINNFNQLETAQDLKSFINWAVNSGESDYLNNCF